MTTTTVKPFIEKHQDGTWTVNPSEPQSRVLVSEHLITGMQAGTGSGKTSVLALWLKMEMDRRGPGDYLAVSPTFPLMEFRVIPELQDFFGVNSTWGVYRPGYHRFESNERINGHPAYRILLGSAVNPDSLESATVKATIIDEIAQSQFPRQAWEAIRRRNAINNGRILFATTLYDVSNWYRVELYDRWKAGNPTINIIQCPSISNPAYPREQWDDAKQTLPPWKFRMFHEGIYEKPTGLIYDAFDEEDGVIDRFTINWDDYTGFVGHDFGPNNTAAVWLAQHNKSGHIFVYRDYHRGDLSVGQHAEEFKRLSKGELIRSRVGGAWGEEENRYAYLASGWPIRKPAIRDVEAGINQVYSFMKRGQFFVFRDCHDFLRELLTYTRELDENYDVTDTIQNKSRFHLLDALRYVMSGFSPERVLGAGKVALIKRWP